MTNLLIKFTKLLPNLYEHKREKTQFTNDKNSKENKNYMGKFWKNAEITNGRLAMIGFLALIINYGFFGWIIPGFI